MLSVHLCSSDDNTLRRSTCRGEILEVQSLGQSCKRKHPYFRRYVNSLIESEFEFSYIISLYNFLNSVWERSKEGVD